MYHLNNKLLFAVVHLNMKVVAIAEKKITSKVVVVMLFFFYKDCMTQFFLLTSLWDKNILNFSIKKKRFSLMENRFNDIIMYIWVGNLQRNVNNLLCRSKFTYFKLKRIDSEHLIVVPCDSVFWILFTGLLKNGHNGNHIE